MKRSKQSRLDAGKTSETTTTSEIRTTKIEFAGRNELRPGSSPPVRKSHSSGTDFARFLDRPDIYLALGQRK
jgi:hypothetical protein